MQPVRLSSHNSRVITTSRGSTLVTLTKISDYNEKYKTWGLKGFDVLANAAP